MNMEQSSILIDIINRFCLENGFASFGFAPPNLPDSYYHRLKHWIEEGNHADMKWLERNIRERTDLTIRFPWVKTVLVVAENYFSNRRFMSQDAKIARYAWGEDYHLLLEKKLKRLISELKAVDCTIEGKVYVDTGPVLEKAFANEAGLGWQGKNTCLIVRNVGSFCFLGVLLLNKEFLLGTPISDRCGSCDRCVKACPTGALSGTGYLDARKCISYLTIEKKGNFTTAEKEKLNNWLYGCDRCQEVCPWNEKWLYSSVDSHYFDRIEKLDRNLLYWEELDEKQFYELFCDSAIRRLTFGRFKRNLNALLTTKVTDC